MRSLFFLILLLTGCACNPKVETRVAVHYNVAFFPEAPVVKVLPEAKPNCDCPRCCPN